MARFAYRLQKILELRDRKKKRQEQRVVEAQARVQEIKTMIQTKKREIQSLRQNMLLAPHMLMSLHDDYIRLMNDELDALYSDLAYAEEQLSIERQLLVKAQSELEAVLKHRDRALEEFDAEEKRLEMLQFDEIAGQRFFRNRHVPDPQANGSQADAGSGGFDEAGGFDED